jgi:hypothetical protein
VNGLCAASVYYCSASGQPVAQSPPASGYINAVSNPSGCNYNACGLNGDPSSCQENFCADAMGSCSNCAIQ